MESLTVKRTLHEIFTCLTFNKELTLGDIAKELGWGSNREIREKGFRINESFNLSCPYFLRPVKQMTKIKDPKCIVSHSQAILSNKGDRVVVIKLT